MTSARLRASPVGQPNTAVLGETQFSATQFMPSNTPYQLGHYPGSPIYPGVFFIESVVLAARSALGGPDTDIDLIEIQKVRFRAPGTPGGEFTITARVTPEPQTRWLLKARCHWDNTTFATMTLRLADRAHEGG